MKRRTFQKLLGIAYTITCLVGLFLTGIGEFALLTPLGIWTIFAKEDVICVPKEWNLK